MTAPTTGPPALPGEVWRGIAVLEGAARTCCVAPDPTSADRLTGPSGTLRAWRWVEHGDALPRLSRWRERGGNDTADVFRAWALHERARAERGEQKADEAFAENAAGLEREKTLRALLAMVATDTDYVWRWQDDGYDHPESLSCPVVMSADTLRAMIGRAERAEAIAAALLVLRKEGEAIDVDEAVAAHVALRALGVEP